jgi:hypothetical protein
MSVTDMGPLYHSYRIFGMRNEQLPGIFGPNQACKEPILLAYIQFAIAKCRTWRSTQVSFAELFCADGYYAMAARHFGATDALGIDNDRDGYFGRSQELAGVLGIDRIAFLNMDVNDIPSLSPVDIVANVGGLYHVSNPEEILRKSYAMANHFLIVQTVVSLTTEAPLYRASPAPGWNWGCRFSRRSFDALIRSTGWTVVDRHFNELEGNDRLEDRGSVYYLIRKPQ